MEKPTDPPIIPRRISSLLPKHLQTALETEKVRSVSAASRLSEMSVESSISDVLDVKLEALETELDYFRCVRDGLTEARETAKISHDDFQREIAPLLKSFRSSSQTLHVLKTQRPLIVEDIDEECSAKRQRVEGPVDQTLLEHAYRDAIISRVLSATAKKKSSKFDQSAFKKKVYSYYGVNEGCRPGFGWCHVLGMPLPEENIKSAHLVPKSMSPKDITHLFGVSDGVLEDPRNGITLASSIELLFDQGTIAIVPTPGPLKNPTRWRCVVLDESKMEYTIGSWNLRENCSDPPYTKLKEIDNRELKFLTDNRPRRRYVYFCFLVAYLQAKMRGCNNAVTEKCEATRFWPSAGEYLNKSTLVTLARCVSGSELPQGLVHNKTFDSGDTTSRDEDAGTVLGADLRDATLPFRES